MIISILSAVIIFGVLIIVHETGHFLVAKRSGVRVIRYSVGYPPKVFGIRRGETEYAFGALPLDCGVVFAALARVSVNP